MNAGGKGLLTSVKRSLFRHPAAVAAGGASLGALAVVNAAAMYRGMDSPWLLATAIVADVIAVGLGALIAAREVMVADQRIEASEQRVAAIVESAMDAIVTVNERQQIVQFNRAAEQLFGCTVAEALGTSLERFLPQRHRSAHKGHVEKFSKTGTTSRRMGDITTLWALRADGTEFPIEASISQATEGSSRYFTVILRDITRRKEFEDELQRSRQELRDLSARVLEAREEEKAHIARELHDELGQMLTALKMDLAELRRSVPAGIPAFEAQAAEMNDLLDKTVSATRRISADLRPLMLDDLGLPDAAGWLVAEFAKRSSVHCDFRLTHAEELQGVPKNVATALYRALQESLTNISRHSGAREAWVVMGVKDGSIHLEVEDNGRGIAPEDLAKVASLGLKGMRERFAYIGGEFEIAPAPRGGTRLRIQVPLRPATREAA
jgi:PAS domain S-box-containing protein